MNNPLTLNYVVPGDDFTRAGEASSNVKMTLKKLGFPSNIIRRVAIALYEGEINMVIHACGGEINVEVCPSVIKMRLADKGPGIKDIDLAMQKGYSTAPDHVRDLGFGAGMGLPNMKNYADTINIESTVGVGTTVCMTILNPMS